MYYDPPDGGVVGRTVTAQLLVSPNGDNTNGKTWATAYNTIQTALDAASTDADDCTLISISPHATYYDINTTGDPTWTGNYILSGTHRLWAAIKNTHNSATSVMKFTGKVSLMDLAIFQTAAIDGVIITSSGFRIRHCGFNSESLTGAATSIYIDGSAALTRGGIIDDIQLVGENEFTKGLYINRSKINEFRHMHMHKCRTGIQIAHAESDYNVFTNLDIGDCDHASGVAIDIDAGNEQHFKDVLLHHNTYNVLDAVGDAMWVNIFGQFDIAVLPDDITAGIAVDTGDGANTWSGSLVTVYTNAGDSPFRIVGANMDCGTTEFYRMQLTTDDGATYFDDLMFYGNKREGVAAPSGTEHIFNKGTVIKARSKSFSAGVDTLDVWLEIQEI